MHARETAWIQVGSARMVLTATRPNQENELLINEFLNFYEYQNT